MTGRSPAPPPHSRAQPRSLPRSPGRAHAASPEVVPANASAAFPSQAPPSPEVVPRTTSMLKVLRRPPEFAQIHVARLRAALSGGGDRTVDGIGRRLLRQLDGRELLRHHPVRARRPA